MTDGNHPQGQPSYQSNSDREPDNMGAPAPPPTNLAAELARMRERFTFFEAFDGQIQDTITSSSELLRTAAAMHTTASREAIASLASLERTVAAEHTRQQRLFDSIRAELSETQRQAERLTSDMDDMGQYASRLAQRVAYLSLILETGAHYGQSPPTTPQPRAAAASPGAAARQDVRETAPPTARPSPQPPSTPSDSPTERDSLPGVGARRLPMTLVFQRVANAAVARSLQRHVDSLDVVGAVASCEYSGNVLRIQLMVERPITLDDLATLPGADDLEPLRILPDVLVVRLPDASAD